MRYGDLKIAGKITKPVDFSIRDEIQAFQHVIGIVSDEEGQELR